MTSSAPNITKLTTGVVLTRSRRKALVAISPLTQPIDGYEPQIKSCAISNQLEDLTVGDKVPIEDSRGVLLLKEIIPRQNCLFRSFGKRRKNICANVDLILIISAAGSLGNTVFIDRVLAAARLAEIPAALVVNKEDASDPAALVETYSALSINLLTTSTRTIKGLDDLKSLILNHNLATVVLCGLSGVGKSSIINCLVPSADRRTQVVSKRTGQGQQTTTQSFGFYLQRPLCKPLLLVDTPGVQNFGLSHLSSQELRMGFEEFVHASTLCKYRDCMHLGEHASECEVIRRVESGGIPETRYLSYLNILDELEFVEKTKYN